MIVYLEGHGSDGSGGDGGQLDKGILEMGDSLDNGSYVQTEWTVMHCKC
jgi:hypothetical protein